MKDSFSCTCVAHNEVTSQLKSQFKAGLEISRYYEPGLTEALYIVYSASPC
jgi:hypothetical protein